MALTASASSKQSFLLKGLAFLRVKKVAKSSLCHPFLSLSSPSMTPYAFIFFFFFILCWLSWSFTFVPFAKFFSSSLSFNLAFSPTFIFYPAHSPVCSHFCHSSSFSLDWFLDFHSFLIILFCSFTVLYGCVVIFLPFPSAFRDFLSSSCCILHLCLFCPAAFYTYFFPICCDLFYYFHFFNLFNLFAP